MLPRRVPRVLLAVAVPVALLGGCTAGSDGTARPPSPPAASGTASTLEAPASSGAAPAGDLAEEVAAATTSRLRQARVVRTPRGLEVLTWWGCDGPSCSVRGEALVRSGPDGTTYRRLRRADRALFTPAEHVPPVPGFGRLVVAPVPSLVSRLRALVAGGDGATLLPFQRVARSVAGGPWVVDDVPLVDGERAYVSGQVVLPDGRLLVLLDHWSGDRPGRPSARHHGLWVTRGGDWGRLDPWRVPGAPAAQVAGQVAGLGVHPRGGGVVWVWTEDGRVLASTDGGTSFRPVDVGRPDPS